MNIWCLVAMLVLCWSTPALYSQSATGAVSGTITDSTGAVLPGVEVSVSNLDTGQTRLAITGDEGRYNAPSLAVGDNYEVRAELPGFQTSVQTGIQLQVGQEVLVSLTLQIGEISEEVIVSSEAPLVNTTSSTISAVISEVQVHELPLNSRNLTQLSLLTPGVVQLRTGTTGGVTQGAPAVRVSIGGARFYQTGFFLDGTDVTDSSRGMGPGGAAGSLFGVETVKEFRVITNNYSAEYSRFSGGVMSMVTKTGTNDIHGSLFMFHRNDNFDAADFFANKFGLGKPEFRRHQFGVTVGGPIVKDRTFFFASFE
ncbi:MAG: carboxypeptidase-like regulatory domain-containing protein [Acidobacteriota bacterium]|nr:carboxypeptidase-like regulatory domain-containing protein [Acidobacteriota bacterium]